MFSAPLSPVTHRVYSSGATARTPVFKERACMSLRAVRLRCCERYVPRACCRVSPSLARHCALRALCTAWPHTRAFSSTLRRAAARAHARSTLVAADCCGVTSVVASANSITAPRTILYNPRSLPSASVETADMLLVLALFCAISVTTAAKLADGCRHVYVDSTVVFKFSAHSRSLTHCQWVQISDIRFAKSSSRQFVRSVLFQESDPTNV